MKKSKKKRPAEAVAETVVDTAVEETAADTAAETKVEIIEPSEESAAEALAAIPKRNAAPLLDGFEDADMDDPSFKRALKKAKKKGRRAFLIRVLKSFIPCRGEGGFELVRKSVLLSGLLVIVAASCLMLEDVYFNPMQNSQQFETIKSQYINDGTLPVLNEAEQSFAYPNGMMDSFKKLYYQNQDIRAWLTFNSTDGTTVKADYPVMWSGDNDYYLNHDFYQTYNKNGSLFFDFRNQFSSPDYVNRNLIIYGHNMASGQMFATLNRLTYGVDYARTSPTFSLDTIYEEADYKVFAVMIVNSDPAHGAPFGYLRTSFSDDVDFANFLAEILARSLYVYGDVDLRPDDDIVTLSTCNTSSEARFVDGRTVVIARRVREGEDPSTDVSKIIYNNDVLMPYAWYQNQNVEPHPYYTDPHYQIDELDSLKSYLEELREQAEAGKSTKPGTPTNVTIPSISVPTTTTTSEDEDDPTTKHTNRTTRRTTTKRPQTTQAQLYTMTVNTPVSYTVGDSFDYKNTQITGWYTNGRRESINPRHCAITGFNTAQPGTYYVTIYYGQLKVSYFMSVHKENSDTPTTGTTPTVITTVSPIIPTSPTAPPTTTTTAAPTTTTEAVVTEPTSPPTEEPTDPTAAEPTEPTAEPIDLQTE